MIGDIRDVEAGRLRADVCIIGGGAAGLTVATELDGMPMRVIVLESGGRRFDERTQELYRSNVVGLSHGGIHSMRFRVFGGSTTRWAGQALPLFDIDFESREWVPGSGWPIGRDDLEPYYGRASELMFIPPFPRRPSDGWPAVLAPPPPFDPHLAVPYFSAFSPRPDFAKTHGASLSRSANVEILLGANVTELVPDAGATCIHAARARSLDGRKVDVEADLFVVCCGGIESARVLLASDGYCEGGLGNGHDLVGRYFQDHPGFAVGAVSSKDLGRIRTAYQPRRSGDMKYVQRFAASEDLQSRERMLNVSGAVVFEQSQSASISAGKVILRALRHPELRQEARTAVRTVARHPAPLLRAAMRYFVLRQPALDTSGTPVLGIGCEQLPNAESRVYLADERDELGMRRTVLDWQLTEQETRTSRRFAEVAASEFERLGFGSVDLDSFSLPDDPTELFGVVIDSGHHMGTTRMAGSPDAGVVDPDCKVFGLDNLYVGSSAVFPTSGFSNPTFTLIALCVRLADKLKQRVTSQVGGRTTSSA